MKSFFHNFISNDDWHHAYLIKKNSEKTLTELFLFFNEKGIITIANPNFYHQKIPFFSIDHSRFFRGYQKEKSTNGEKKIFVLEINSFSREAENALLKVFEEPSPDVHFFIVMPRPEEVIDTLKSRLFFIDAPYEDFLNSENEENLNLVKSFIQFKKNERLDWIKNILKEYEEDEEHLPLKEKVNDIFKIIIYLLRQALLNKNKLKEPVNFQIFLIENLEKKRNLIFEKGSSVKMILEHLALVL